MTHYAATDLYDPEGNHWHIYLQGPNKAIDEETLITVLRNHAVFSSELLSLSPFALPKSAEDMAHARTTNIAPFDYVATQTILRWLNATTPTIKTWDVTIRQDSVRHKGITVQAATREEAEKLALVNVEELDWNEEDWDGDEYATVNCQQVAP